MYTVTNSELTVSSVLALAKTNAELCIEATGRIIKVADYPTNLKSIINNAVYTARLKAGLVASHPDAAPKPATGARPARSSHKGLSVEIDGLSCKLSSAGIPTTLVFDQFGHIATDFAGMVAFSGFGTLVMKNGLAAALNGMPETVAGAPVDGRWSFAYNGKTYFADGALDDKAARKNIYQQLVADVDDDDLTIKVVTPTKPTSKLSEWIAGLPVVPATTTSATVPVADAAEAALA